MQRVARTGRILRSGAVVTLAMALTTLSPVPAAAHGTWTLSVDTTEGTLNYVKAQVRITFSEPHYTVCAQVSMQYKEGGTWHNWQGGGQFNCNDYHNVRTAQATITGPVCGADNDIFAWRAYGFGSAIKQDNTLAHRVPQSGYKFDSTPLLTDFC